MKTKRTLFVIVVSLLLACLYIAAKAQPESQPAPSPEELLGRIAEIENAYHTILEIDNERYNDAVKTITQGLQNASDIQHLLPSSLLLLTYSDLKTLEANMNNPTFEGLGDKFTDQIVEAAGEHLILRYSDEPKQDAEETTHGRFKNFLRGVFNNSVVQSLLMSNPITGFVSTAIQHAAAFEKPRTATVTLTGDEIRSLVKGKHSDPMVVPTSSISNQDGPAYDLPMVERFYTALHARIDFYQKLAAHTDSIHRMNNELKVEAYALQKQIKTSRTILCATLGIDENNYHNSLVEKLKTKTSRQWLKDKQFEKALTLAAQANEMLPEVIQLHKTIVNGAILDVKGHRFILKSYLNNPVLAEEARLDVQKLQQRLSELNTIQRQLEGYLPVR